jgi:antitoxin component of MazEF toxin-antitoxin module
MSQLNYEELTKGLTTKSEKIRVLGRKGVPTADIARFLGIRYQHARNVLNDAGLQNGGMAEEMPSELETKMLPPVKSAAPVPWDWGFAWLDVGPDGTVRLPEKLMAAAGITPGSTVHVCYADDCLEVMTEDSALRRAQALAASIKVEGESVVDEFLREKREETKRVDARFDRLEREAAAMKVAREKTA